MNSVRSFPPLADTQARLLILGSMPGTASLQMQQYYAHPRNAFWPIMQALFGIDTALPYEQRCRLLNGKGIAVWDVLKSCTRPGSLDADIDAESMMPNDFAGFLAAHAGVRAICFNGTLAERTYRRRVLPYLPAPASRLPLRRLPSTSPANASYSFERKLALWRVVAASR